MRKLTTKEFIEKAINIHGDTYIYSKTNYITSHKKVLITCRTHGDFLQKANNHLNGKGCYQCFGNIKITTKEFIEKAIKKHGNRFDYKKTKFKNSKTKLIITCKIHGDFEQLPKDHLISKDCCPKCRKNFKKTNQEFIDKANIVHNYKYDYSKSFYENINDHVIIICKLHGEFKQIPYNHLIGHGCGECAKNVLRRTLEQFINEAIKIHGDKYIYSKVDYKNNGTKVIIICKKHGEFEQAPSCHLNQQGCPKCSNNISKKETKWLDYVGIPKKYRNIKILVNDKYISIDGFDPETNTIYEFYGDYWHGNPVKYKPQDINKNNKKTFGELYQNTLKKEKILIKAGYKLITIWENEWTKKKNH